MHVTPAESPGYQVSLPPPIPDVRSEKPTEKSPREVGAGFGAQIPSIAASYNETPVRPHESRINQRKEEVVFPVSIKNARNRTQQNSPSEASEARIAIPKSVYSRPPPERIQCPDCSIHPRGYRGEHELQRHRARVHAPKRKVYLCVDASSDGKLLADCSQCKKGKFYNAYYNAAAHLRRRHFDDSKRGKGQSKSSTAQRRGGKGAGQYPPMDVLKKFLKEIEIDMDDPRNAMEVDDDDDNDTSSLPQNTEPKIAPEDTNNGLSPHKRIQAAETSRPADGPLTTTIGVVN